MCRLQRGERLDLRIVRDACLVAIAAELPAHDLRRIERPHRAEKPQLLGAHRLGVAADRRIHRQQRDHLQQMILHDVADRRRPLRRSCRGPARRSFRPS